MDGDREPRNLVWWMLGAALLISFLLDNPLHWNREMLLEREARLATARQASVSVHGPARLTGIPMLASFRPSHQVFRAPLAPESGQR